MPEDSGVNGVRVHPSELQPPLELPEHYPTHGSKMLVDLMLDQWEEQLNDCLLAGA